MTDPMPPGGSPTPSSDRLFPSNTWGPADPYGSPSYGVPAPYAPPGSPGSAGYTAGTAAGNPYALGPGHGQPPGDPYDYGYGSPYFYPGLRPPQPTDGFAIASLIVSVLSVSGICLYGLPGLLGILGAIFGHVARHRIRTTGANGSGIALAGVIIGWTTAAIGVLLITVLVVVTLTSGLDF